MIKPGMNRSNDWRQIIRSGTLEEVQARVVAHVVAHSSHTSDSTTALSWHEIVYFGDSLLYIALRAERKDVFEYLLTLPAARLALEREGGDLLRVAVEKSREWIIFLLSLADEHKVSIINQLDHCGVSALYWVKDTETLHLLLDKKADINIKQNQAKSIAGIYAHRGHGDLLQILMDRGTTMDEDVLVQAGQGRLDEFEGDVWQERPANHLQIFRSLKHLSPTTWKRAATLLRKKSAANDNYYAVEPYFPLPSDRDILHELDDYALNKGVTSLQTKILHHSALPSDVGMIVRDYALPAFFLLDVSEKSLPCFHSMTLIPPRIWCILLRLCKVARGVMNLRSPPAHTRHKAGRCERFHFKECARDWDHHSCLMYLHEHHIHIGEIIEAADIIAFVEQDHVEMMPFSFASLKEHWQLAYGKLFQEYMVQYRKEYIRLHPNLHINDEVLELVQEVQHYFSSLPIRTNLAVEEEVDEEDGSHIEDMEV